MNQRKLAVALAVALAISPVTACGSDQDQTNVSAEVDTTSAPVEVEWIAGPAGLSYPVSAVSGPMAQDGVPHSFDDSPQGAVIAAIVGQVFMAGADDETWPAVGQNLLEPGPGRDQWAQARALMTVDGTMENPPTFEGFHVDQYSEDATIVTLAVNYPGGILAALPVQLSRSSGDWRTVVPTQEQAPDLTEITPEDLAERFTAFSATEGAN